MPVSNPSPSKLELVPTVAGMPYLVKGKPAEAFKKLKAQCIESCGHDFLAVCADVMRSKNFSTTKPGAAKFTNHKTGRAFDCQQDVPYLIYAPETRDGKQYFRTWLKCAAQDGSQGERITLKDVRNFVVTGYYWDFTKAAEALGWSRIPAHKGWGTKGTAYNLMEAWHYEMMEGLSWQQAMDQIYNVPAVEVDLTVFKNGSSGPVVKDYQSKLYNLGFLASVKDVDGQYGPHTELAVKAFQKANGLSADGVLGPFTRNKIDQLIKEKSKMGFEYNVDEVNAAVTAEADENSTPKPFYATSQFAVLLATYILGPVAMYLTAKGLLTPETAPQFVAILQGAIVVGMGWVSQKFIAGRNEVSAIKARAAAVRSLSAHGPEALAAFRAVDRS